VEHGSALENELIELVETLTRVAADLERGEFDPRSLDNLVNRPDELGQLGRAFRTMGQEVSARARRLRMLRVVVPAGVALSAVKDFNRLLETIVVEAKRSANADSGILFLLTDDQRLQFMIVHNDSLELRQGGTSAQAVTFAALPLYDAEGRPNQREVAVHAALTHAPVNVADAYGDPDFDFAILKAFDAQTGYHSTSCLTFPLVDEQDQVVGVLQLINAKDPQTGALISFTPDDVIETLVMLGSAALSNYKREERLLKEIEKLRIQIDATTMNREVEQITESDYFQDLQQRAKGWRRRG
jgi:GAF domain-containing protein